MVVLHIALRIARTVPLVAPRRLSPTDGDIYWIREVVTASRRIRKKRWANYSRTA